MEGPPHDTEKAFDTGGTFWSVMKLYGQGKPINEAAKQVSDSVLNKLMRLQVQQVGNAGVNAAHR
jgi:hypothetical protein